MGLAFSDMLDGVLKLNFVLDKQIASKLDMHKGDL
jgi:hypothetical protein